MAISSNDGNQYGSAHGGSSGCDETRRSGAAACDREDVATERGLASMPVADFAGLVRAVAAAEAQSESPPEAEPDETRVVDHDLVLRAARLALWRATFSLPGWLLLVTDLPDETRPHVRVDDVRRSAIAFTDEFAALQYQAEGGLTFTAGFATYQTPIDQSIEMVESAADGAAVNLVFNDGHEMFGAPIAMLRRLHRHVEHGDDPDALDATFTEVNGDSTPIGPMLAAGARTPGGEDHARAIDALLGLSDWWFVCNPNQPDAFHVRRFAMARDGRPVRIQAVVAFTAHRLAMEATDRYGLADRDGSIVLMQMPAKDAVEWLQSFRDHDVETVMFDALTTPFAVPIAELLEWWKRRETPASA